MGQGEGRGCRGIYYGRWEVTSEEEEVRGGYVKSMMEMVSSGGVNRQGLQKRCSPTSLQLCGACEPVMGSKAAQHLPSAAREVTGSSAFTRSNAFTGSNALLPPCCTAGA